MPTEAKESLSSLRQLTFEYKFKYDFDIVFFAHYMPYTYTDLCNYLCKLDYQQNHKEKLRIDYLCKSLT